MLGTLILDEAADLTGMVDVEDVEDLGGLDDSGGRVFVV